MKKLFTLILLTAGTWTTARADKAARGARVDAVVAVARGDDRRVDAVLAGVVAAALAWLWEKHLGHGTLMLKAGVVFVPGGIAVLVYWLVALWLKVPAAQEMTNLALQKFRKATKRLSV